MPHALVWALGSPAPDADVENCKNECNQLTGDKPPLGWRIHADRLPRTRWCAIVFR